MLVKEAELRAFVTAGIVQRTLITRETNGWLVHVQIGDALYTLQRQRGGDRTFKSLDKLAALLEELGLSVFEVQLIDSAIQKAR